MEEHKIAQPAAHYEFAIPNELIDLIIKEIDNIQDCQYTEAKIGSLSDSSIDMVARNSKVSWWYESHWACSIFSHYFNMVNRNFWEYDLTYLDGIQISTYEKDDHYTWHCDYGTSKDARHTRKISASLLVTDPDDFDGGDLQFINYHGNTVVAPRTKGTMVIFDSRIPHRVTPVTRGKRVSLVAWMLGPKLR
jgi:PKHD-type hydroxylase